MAEAAHRTDADKLSVTYSRRERARSGGYRL